MIQVGDQFCSCFGRLITIVSIRAGFAKVDNGWPVALESISYQGTIQNWCKVTPQNRSWIENQIELGKTHKPVPRMIWFKYMPSRQNSLALKMLLR